MVSRRRCPRRVPGSYRAIDLEYSGDVTYEFITEGGQGHWENVLQGFASVAKLSQAKDANEFAQQYSQLDDNTSISFGGSNSDFWSLKTTMKQIFDRITEHLRSNAAPEGEAVALSRRKVAHLLPNFKFAGNVIEEELESDIDSALLGVVDHRETIVPLRNALVGWIVKRSKVGNCTISPGEMLRENGIANVLPIQRWAIIKEQARSRVKRLFFEHATAQWTHERGSFHQTMTEPLSRRARRRLSTLRFPRPTAAAV